VVDSVLGSVVLVVVSLVVAVDVDAVDVDVVNVCVVVGHTLMCPAGQFSGLVANLSQLLPR